MSVSRAQAEINSAEFTEWAAYLRIEPIFFDRSEHMLSIIASILCNVHRERGSKVFKPEDFLPKFGPPTKESAEDIEMKLRAFFNGHHK